MTDNDILSPMSMFSVEITYIDMSAMNIVRLMKNSFLLLRTVKYAKVTVIADAIA